MAKKDCPDDVPAFRLCCRCWRLKEAGKSNAAPYCTACRNAVGRVEVIRMHNYFADRPRLTHCGFDEIQAPGQENAVRVLEEDR